MKTRKDNVIDLVNKHEEIVKFLKIVQIQMWMKCFDYFKMFC